MNEFRKEPIPKMSKRNESDKEKTYIPDITIMSPLEQLKVYGRNLALSIESNNPTLIHNNINWLRKAMDEYEIERRGTTDELPF